MIVSDFAIRRRVAVFVLIVVLLIAGTVSYMTLPREGTPDLTIPFVFVTAVYEGTAPAEIETLITIPIERQVRNVDHVREMRSTSGDSFSMVAVEFDAGRDIDEARQRVKDAVDLARPDLPDDLSEPVVDAFNIGTDFPIYIFTLSGEVAPDRLRHLAEQLQDRIEQVPGVRQVDIAGTREREIRVNIDLPRMLAYDVPLGLVLQRIRDENVTLSAGHLELRDDRFQVRLPGEFDRAAELRGLMLTERDGAPVYLGDIATTEDTFKDLDSLSRLNGEPSVSIMVKKRAGVNSVAMIGDVKALLEATDLPPGVTRTEVMDLSEYVASMLDELENNIATGFLLVVTVLLIFLGLRTSLFVALAIPLSMLLAFVLLSLMGITLNMIVLFSLVLAVGMLVDNAVVVVENIYRHRSEGASRREAAQRGASEVAWPVITSTLTTLAAFSPLLFWPGIEGQFMGFLPRTLITVLSASLFVAIVINPAVCSAFIHARPRDRKERTHPFVQRYERLLRGALAHRLPVLLLGFTLLAFTALLYGRLDRGVEYFPETEPRYATISVRFPQGTGIERTDEAIRAIEAIVAPMNDVDFYLATVGAQDDMFGMGGRGTHLGSVRIEFVDAAVRSVDSNTLIERIRAQLPPMPGVEVTIEREEMGPPTEAPISIEVAGEDFEDILDHAVRIMRRIESVPGLVDLHTDAEAALPELQFEIDRHRAALHGLDTRTVGLFLRMAIHGIEAGQLRADEEEYDITLRLRADQRDSLALLDEIRIPTPQGVSVPLASLGRFRYTGGLGAIQRADGRRMVTITGNTTGRGIREVLADIQQRVEDMDHPHGHTIAYRGQDESMREASAFLLRAFGIALGLILIILVLQFNSAILPLIIVFSVVLSMIGVLWGLILTGMRFGVIMTGVGIISLAGIVVNNSIVLVDCILQQRRAGLDRTEAVVLAGRLRLRPVLLTATTTILGLIPMAIGLSINFQSWPPSVIRSAETSAWWAPMAVAVIFGLALATLLTLVLVPVMYHLFDSLAARLRRKDAQI